jgi:4-diphosphocytidyl-2-C-methyl-D-erythritol kinase
VLLALARRWGLDPSDPRIHDAAAEVGSDVPFFLGGGSAIARGRGTELTPAPRGFNGWIALLLPPFGVSTAAVYAACRPTPPQADERPPWASPWRSATELSSRLCNDLFPAAGAVEPRLAALHAAVDGAEGVRVHLSGSGGTLFALFDHGRAAHAWCDAIAGKSHPMSLRIVRAYGGPPCAWLNQQCEPCS